MAFGSVPSPSQQQRDLFGDCFFPGRRKSTQWGPFQPKRPLRAHRSRFSPEQRPLGESCGSLAGRHLLDGAEPRSHPSPAQRRWDPGVDGPSSGCSGSREHCAGPAPPRQPRRAPAGPSPALLPSCRPGCADSPACSWLHGPHAAAPPAGLAPAFQGGPGEGRREGASWRRRPLSAAGPPCALCRSRSGGRRPGGP